MANKADFVLALIDKLTGPARIMAKALGSLQKSQAAVEKAAGTMDSKIAKSGESVVKAGAMATRGAESFKRAADVIDKAAAGRQRSLDRMARIREMGLGAHRASIMPEHAIGPVLDRGAQNLSLGTRISSAVGGMMRWNQAAGEGIAKWQELIGAFMRTPFGYVLGGLGKVASFLFDIGKAVVSALFDVGKLVVALGAIAAITFTKQVVEMGAFADRSKRALGFITGDKALGKKEFADAVKLSEDLGLSVEDTVAQYSKLRSMQFSAVEATGLVKLSKDLEAITGDAQSAERALVAMTQIKAKGKLQSEELVGQLAEAGVSTVLVYKELEKILGTDRSGVLKRLQGGQIDSETGLVAITRALKAKYHVDEFGKIGGEFANQTPGGLMDALKSDFGRAFMRVGEQVNMAPLIKSLQFLRETIQKAFSDGSAVKFVDAMIAGLSKLIPLVVDFAEGFASGLDGIAKALQFGEVANLKQWAFDAGKGVATFFERVISVTKSVVAELPAALSALFEGINVNQILEDMKGFDWKEFGQNLVVIAKALGAIVNAMAGLAGFAISPSDTTAKALGVDGRSNDDAMVTWRKATGSTTTGPQSFVERRQWEEEQRWKWIKSLFGFGDEEASPGKGATAPSIKPTSTSARPQGSSVSYRFGDIRIDASGAKDARETGETVRDAIRDAFGLNTRTAASAY